MTMKILLAGDPSVSFVSSFSYIFLENSGLCIEILSSTIPTRLLIRVFSIMSRGYYSVCD